MHFGLTGRGEYVTVWVILRSWERVLCYCFTFATDTPPMTRTA